MTIKNLRIVIILLALSLLLCGCKAGKKDAVNTPAAETTSVATPEPAAETKPAATPEPAVSEIAVKDDPKRPGLDLKATEWSGYVCLFPESFEITYTSADVLDAAEPDEREEGLIDVAYVRVEYNASFPELYWNAQTALPDPMLNGAARDAFEKDLGHQITAGVHGYCFRHQTEGYTLCLSALYNGMEVVIVRGIARSEDGEADFDSVIRRFIALDARRRADAMGEGYNPFFTCEGTAYQKYPLILAEDYKAEALAFLNENRAAIEEAAKTALETKDLKAIRALLEETEIDVERNNPSPVFEEGAAPYLEFCFPRAIDTTYDDPGILYYVGLIYTTNTEEQISDGYYQSFMEPVGENWFYYEYYYAY
jgi:hypothetical protein